MTEEEQVRFGKLVDLLHDRHLDQVKKRDAIEHYKYQLGKCDDFMRHQAHEIAKLEGKPLELSSAERKDAIRNILVRATGRDEEFSTEVELLDAYIERYHMPKEEAE